MTEARPREHSAIRPSDGRRRSPLVQAITFSHSSTTSPFKRRVITIAIYSIAWLLVSLLWPIWIPVSFFVGLIRKQRFIVLRMLFFVWGFLTIELMGLAGAGLVHMTSRRGSEKFQDRFFKLYLWWGTSIFRWIKWLLNISVEVQGDDAIGTGPVLVFIRHASIIDTALPLVYMSNTKGLRLRYVFKRELLMDPCIDVAGHAWPNYFIDRGGDPAKELEGVRKLTYELGEEGVLLFPEGTRFTKLKQKRAIRVLGRTHPSLVPLAESMTHCLPPKPGGVLTLMEAAPHADILVVAHRGLEGFAEVSDLLRGGVVGKKLEIKMWRIPAEEIPPPDKRLTWLFKLWKQVDDFAAQGFAGSG